MPHNYILKRSSRKTLAIKIVDDKLYAYAPLLMPTKEIEQFIESHHRWIDKRLNNKRINVIFDLEHDEYIYLLGKRYKLNIVLNKKEDVNISGDTLTISGKNINTIYRKYSYYLASIIEDYVDQIKKELRVDFYLQFKPYKTRWGCCYPKKRLIILNLYTACLPVELIKHVIYHEITHFKVNNHQQKFYIELEKICPDYKKQIKELKNYTLHG